MSGLLYGSGHAPEGSHLAGALNLSAGIIGVSDSASKHFFQRVGRNFADWKNDLPSRVAGGEFGGFGSVIDSRCKGGHQ